MDDINEINDSISYIYENFVGKDVNTLSKLFNITSKCKQKNSLITKAMFLNSNALLFSNKNSCIIRTVQLDKYNRLSQSISFPAFDFNKIIKEQWESSDLRKMLINNIFIFVVFKHSDSKTILEKVFLWNMPIDIIDKSVIEVWNKTKEVIQTGNIVKYSENGRYFTNFPGSKENPYMHVRPHSQNKDDVKELPIPDRITGMKKYAKQCFWLNKSYINKIINEYE